MLSNGSILSVLRGTWMSYLRTVIEKAPSKATHVVVWGLELFTDDSSVNNMVWIAEVYFVKHFENVVVGV